MVNSSICPCPIKENSPRWITQGNICRAAKITRECSVHIAHGVQYPDRGAIRCQRRRGAGKPNGNKRHPSAPHTRSRWCTAWHQRCAVLPSRRLAADDAPSWEKQKSVLAVTWRPSLFQRAKIGQKCPFHIDRRGHCFNNASPRFLSSLEKGCSEIGFFGVLSAMTFSKRCSDSELLMTIFRSNVLVAIVCAPLSCDGQIHHVIFSFLIAQKFRNAMLIVSV